MQQIVLHGAMAERATSSKTYNAPNCSTRASKYDTLETQTHSDGTQTVLRRWLHIVWNHVNNKVWRQLRRNSDGQTQTLTQTPLVDSKPPLVIRNLRNVSRFPTRHAQRCAGSPACLPYMSIASALDKLLNISCRRFQMQWKPYGDPLTFSHLCKYLRHRTPRSSARARASMCILKCHY